MRSVGYHLSARLFGLLNGDQPAIRALKKSKHIKPAPGVTASKFTHSMSTKKTAAKKAARKRSAKQSQEEVNSEVSAGEVVSAPQEGGVEEKPAKKKSARKSAKKAAKKPEQVNSVATPTQEAAPESSDDSSAREPKQGVRDVRTQPAEGDSTSDKPAQGQQSAEGGQPSDESQEGGQGRSRNKRGRRNRGGKADAAPQQQNQAAIQINPEELNEKAWSVFLAEVSEEGLALIGDKEGKELAKRSFKLAELFLEEQGRKNQSLQGQQRQRRNPAPRQQEDRQTDHHAADQEPAVTEGKQDHSEEA